MNENELVRYTIGGKLTYITETQAGEIVTMAPAAIDTIYERWAAGLAGPAETLRALCADLAWVDAALNPLEQRKQAIRNSISEIINTLDNQRTDLAGFGRLEMTAPVLTTSYDKQHLDRLIIELTEAGEHTIAQRVAGCRKESARADGLRITREKQR